MMGIISIIILAIIAVSSLIAANWYKANHRAAKLVITALTLEIAVLNHELETALREKAAAETAPPIKFGAN